MIRPLRFVVLTQAFPELVRLNADDGVFLLIEIRRASQRLDGDIVLLDLLASAVEIFGANVG
jgi:hypothetical protein